MKILKFEAAWCQPCKQLATILADCEFPIKSVDVKKHPELVEKFNIKSVPTIVIVADNGDEMHFVGKTTLADVTAAAKRMVEAEKSIAVTAR